MIMYVEVIYYLLERNWSVMLLVMIFIKHHLDVSPSPDWLSSKMTSSNGTIFRVTDHLCGEFTQWPVTRSFDVFFDLRLNKRLSKQSWGWWFKMLSRPLWSHCNVHWPKYNNIKAMIKRFSGTDGNIGMIEITVCYSDKGLGQLRA